MSAPRYEFGPTELQKTVADMARNRRRAASEAAAQSLQSRLDHLTLACEAMWSLMREKFGLSDEDLRRRMIDLDLSDGALDGVARREPKSCDKCQRVIPQRAARCIYCGRPTDMDPFAT